MNKEEQYLLFALSAPMEILNQGCKPAHDSPKMYTGIKEFDLSSSWGINNRDDLIIEVDGGVKADNIAQIAKAGANMFVSGSAIFNS